MDEEGEHRDDEGRCVLLVEDDEPVRTAIADVLKDNGYRVYSCSNGMEAVNLYGRKRKKIGLVLLDIEMPLIDGEAAFDIFRTVDAAPRVLLISGAREADRRSEKMIRKGAIELMRKPIDPEELLRKVDHFLNCRPLDPLGENV